MKILSQDFKLIPNLSYDQRKWLSIIFICTVVLVLFACIIPGSATKLATLKKQLSIQKEYLATGADKLKTITGTTDRYKEIIERMEESKKMFFSDQDVSLFLKNLNKLASSAGGQIELIKPVGDEFVSESKIDDKKPFVYIKSSVHVNFSGDFESVLNLLNILKSNSKLTSIERIDIVGLRGQSGQLRVNFVLAMHKLIEKIGK